MKKWKYCLVILIFLLLVLPVTSLENGKIAFVSNRDGNFEIYVMDADGTSQTRLTTESTYDGEPAWSPDGLKIAFVSNRDGNNETYVMNPDGTNQVRITNNVADDIEPAWSSDGSKIAFSSNRDGDISIFIMNPDGTDQQYLARGSHPAWSPDRSKISFVSIRDGSKEIYVMNADGTSQTRITSNQFSELHPVWSPDGSKITYETNRDGTWTWDIYSMNPDGTGLSRLTMENDGEPAWSPDGSKIVFQSWRNDAIPQIYIMNPDGMEQTRITFNAALDSHPAWARIPSKSPIPTNIKIVPKTINLGSKGYFLAVVTLPEVYKGSTIDINTVSCSGAPAVRMMNLKIFPRVVGFVFRTNEVKDLELGKKVSLNVKGKLKNQEIMYTFSGSDTVRVISKSGWQPDDIKDVSKLSDDQLFKIYFK